MSEYVEASVSKIGIDQSQGTGIMILQTSDHHEIPMTSFSQEVGEFISRFSNGDRTSIPTVYKLIEELAESNMLYLENVEVYSLGGIMRANIHFRGRGRDKDLTLKHYRASDAIALAVFYDATIMVHKDLVIDRVGLS